MAGGVCWKFYMMYKPGVSVPPEGVGTHRVFVFLKDRLKEKEG